ncbi:MAG: gluconate 2-dehydrogenase subunit 3 family protein [Planctomycetota bacterium]|nr:gluconate 2-dehydrogenase subunit 3 family protein [Planctomycetota bacterium]
MGAPDEPRADGQDDVSRRAFLAAGAGAAGVSALSFYWFAEFGDPARRAQVELTPPGAPGSTFTAAQMRTAEAACDRLLPSGPGAPGARDVGAARYLDAVLATAFVTAETKAVILDGLARLDERAREMGVAAFADASLAQQDNAIRVFETFSRNGDFPGHRWLRAMLRFVFEAFLGDPVHGGNPDGIGWNWIGHPTPEPRPTTPGWAPREKDTPR